MRGLRNSSMPLLLLSLALPGLAQSAAPAQHSSPGAGAAAQRARIQRRRTPPCWKQAGMTADMVNQRWELEDQQKLKIAQVCADPSTSAQQKHDRIDQIHADTDHALAKLIPASELAVFNKCQADLGQDRPKPTGQKELGPCGGVIPSGTSMDATGEPEHHHANAPTNH